MFQLYSNHIKPNSSTVPAWNSKLSRDDDCKNCLCHFEEHFSITRAARARAPPLSAAASRDARGATARQIRRDAPLLLPPPPPAALLGTDARLAPFATSLCRAPPPFPPRFSFPLAFPTRKSPPLPPPQCATEPLFALSESGPHCTEAQREKGNSNRKGEKSPC